jgi:hypothetical protein
MGAFARLIGVAIAVGTMGAPAAEALLGEGRPVTACDISGKKICWNSGSWILFAANGQLKETGLQRVE